MFLCMQGKFSVKKATSQGDDCTICRFRHCVCIYRGCETLRLRTILHGSWALIRCCCAAHSVDADVIHRRPNDVIITRRCCCRGCERGLSTLLHHEQRVNLALFARLHRPVIYNLRPTCWDTFRHSQPAQPSGSLASALRHIQTGIRFAFIFVLGCRQPGWKVEWHSSGIPTDFCLGIRFA